MPRGPKGVKRPADVIGNAVHVMRIATGGGAATAPQNASERARSGSKAIPIRSISAHLLPNVRTLQCGCRCADLADECVLQEIRKPHAHGRALYGLVQLRETA